MFVNDLKLCNRTFFKTSIVNEIKTNKCLTSNGSFELYSLLCNVLS